MTDPQHHDDVSTDSTEQPARPARKPYEAPRVEKRRSLKRVTLLSGMGVAGVGVISTMA